MALSVLDLFSVGIGPSSSHTVGPMRAGRRFALGLVERGLVEATERIHVQLFGSLGATGHGHGSDRAVLLGLEGEDPETVDTERANSRVESMKAERRLSLAGGPEQGGKDLAFDPEADLVMHRRKSLPYHPNGMSFTAYDADGEVVVERVYYSVGGGFVVDDEAAGADRVVEDTTRLPLPFGSGKELLAHCEREGISVPELMRRNEEAFRPWEQTRAALLNIWQVMQDCVEAGCESTGTLPGGLKVPRRAALLKEQLELSAPRDGSAPKDGSAPDALGAMEWVNLYALAVNEQNASGGRIVTAPTNGAAGIIPAVLHYWRDFLTREMTPEQVEDGVVEFLLTAAAIGILIKENASISGAEMGCQGEVGSACSMAAAGLCQLLGGTPRQVENAAEVGIEHNLGLTCDPVGGLVQIPCIERNAIASVKAINAARLCRRGDGRHTVSLDQVIKTMRETGQDMKIKYKETSRGGLAVNVIEC
ncbi:L-serine ammonia-lyase [Micrococcus sp. IITD107]|uniref:L-serine ammonia-lyase n=1 Tax=Micrococcus sp. IITD107 TaxID=3342790 RepID=UPI0035B7341D